MFSLVGVLNFKPKRRVKKIWFNFLANQVCSPWACQGPPILDLLGCLLEGLWALRKCKVRLDSTMPGLLIVNKPIGLAHWRPLGQSEIRRNVINEI